ncbi:hypothetical protein FOZ62_000676 [Perkinsus olseni]|uniref:Sfi1 spindle body domain-containing protein n=1 Tax=Perkinsus olseni TaxID=32597 RepID=A0A7J6SLC7_PEROL|nr:hypothetical protein FOZ62_000676 [Perkinsus olseni]
MGRIESAVSLSHRQSLSLCRRILSSWKAHNNLMNSGRALNYSKLLKSLRAVVEGWKQVRDRCYNLRGSARAFRQYRAGIALWKKEQGMADQIAIFAVRAKIFGHLSAWHAAAERRILARSKLVTERLRANFLRWQELSRRNRLKRLLVFWRYQSRRSSLERRLIAVVTFAWLALGRQRKRWYLEHVFETWKESTKISRAVSKRVKQRAAVHHFIEWYGVLWTARASRVGGYLRLAGRLAFCFTRWASISKSRVRIRQISWTRPTERGRIFAAWLRLQLAVRRGDLLTMRRSLKGFRFYHRHKIRLRLDDRRRAAAIETRRQRKIWDFMRNNFVARDFDLRRAFKRYRKTVAVRRLKLSRRSALRRLILRKYFTRMQRLHCALLNSRINSANRCFNGWSDVARRIRFARSAYRELIGHHFILWRDKTVSSSRLRGIAYGILVRQLRSAWAVFREAIRLRRLYGQAPLPLLDDSPGDAWFTPKSSFRRARVT